MKLVRENSEIFFKGVYLGDITTYEGGTECLQLEGFPELVFEASLNDLFELVDFVSFYYAINDILAASYFTNINEVMLSDKWGFHKIKQMRVSFGIHRNSRHLNKFGAYFYHFMHALINNPRYLSSDSDINYGSVKSIELFVNRSEFYLAEGFPEVITVQFDSSDFYDVNDCRNFVDELILSSDKYAQSYMGLSEQNSFERTIEFTPETFQAGIGILNYFGTYLREQYPDEKAYVKIEQNDLSVKLTINSSTGKSETIEKAFNEYGQIMSGSSSVVDIVSNPLLIAKLENKIDLLNAELNSERRLNNLQASTIKDFVEMFRISHDKSSNYQFVLSNTNSNNVSISINNEIASTLGALRELKEALPVENPLQNELDDITHSLEAIENESSAEVVKKSSALSKLKRFIDKVNKGQEVASSAIKTIERGAEIFNSLVAKYHGLMDTLNSIQ